MMMIFKVKASNQWGIDLRKIDLIDNQLILLER